MNPRRPRSPGAAAAGVVAALLAAAPAFAQTPTSAPTADQRRQAGAAFDSGQAARAQRDFVSAANFFETADRLAPAPQALGNAIESHRAIRTPAHDARAATLALRMLTRYASEARLVAYANRVITELAPSLARVQVTCSAACDLEVDHTLTSDTEFFIEPGAHSVTGSWSNDRTRTREFSAVRGGTETLTLEAPPMPAVVAPPTLPVTAPAVGEPATRPGAVVTAPGERPGTMASTVTPPLRDRGSSASGISPAFFVTGLALTAVSGGILLWSGVDAMQGVGPYESNPTPEGLADGQARELRTNVLIGTTAGLGVLTLTSLFFTRWGRGGARVEAAPTVRGANGMAPGLTLRGRF